MTPLSTDDTFFRLTSTERYAQVIRHLKKRQAIWALADAEGCLIIELGSDKVLPIWPTESLALRWGAKEYADFKGLKVLAESWSAKWLPGMEKDGYQVGVAPNLAGECIVSSAQEHAHDIHA